MQGPSPTSRLLVSASSVRLELRPHRSLDARGVWIFLTIFTLVAFAGAAAAALYGAWPALIFAGGEVFAVTIALRLNMRDAEQLHAIVLDEEHVTVQITERGRTSETIFPRYWTRIRLRDPGCLFHPRELQLECQGKSCEIGPFLTELERAEVEKFLRPVVGPCGRAPSLLAAQDALRQLTFVSLLSPEKT